MASDLTDDELKRRMDRARERGELRDLGLAPPPGSMAAFNARERARRQRDAQREQDERARIAQGWNSWTIDEKIKNVNRAVDANMKQFDRLYRAVRDARAAGRDYRPALADYNAFCSQFLDISDDLKQKKQSAYANDRATRILMDTRSRIISRLIDFNAKYPVMVHDFNAFPRRVNKKGRATKRMDIKQVPNNAYEINPLGFPVAVARPRIDSDVTSSPNRISSFRVQSPQPTVGKPKTFILERPQILYGEYDYASLIDRGIPFRGKLGDEKFEDIMARYILALQTGDMQRASDMEAYYNLTIPAFKAAGIFRIYKEQWLKRNLFADFSDPATYGKFRLPPDLKLDRFGRVVLLWNVGEKTPPPAPSEDLKPTPLRPPGPRVNKKREVVKGGNIPPNPKRQEAGSSNMPVDDGRFLLEKLNLKY